MLTFDFEKLDYISSAGLGMLLAAQKTMNNHGNMKVKNANEIILEIFETTGFSDILTIEYPDQQSAREIPRADRFYENHLSFNLLTSIRHRIAGT